MSTFVVALALSWWACESSTPTGPSGFARARNLQACPAQPTVECPSGPCLPQFRPPWRAGHLVTCPSRAEIDAIDSEIGIQIVNDPTAGTLWCREEAGSADLTYAQRNLYWGLAFLRQLEFTQPLPWTNRPLYEWFKQQVRTVIIETGTRYTYYNGSTRAIHLVYYPTYDPEAHPGTRLPYETLVHEARHGDGPPHNCSNNRDSHISMMGSDGVVWYLNEWIANFSNQPPEIREAASLLNLYQIRGFCYECESEGQ